MKHLKQEEKGFAETLWVNMLQDCPLTSKAVFKKEKMGCYNGYIIEPAGAARKWSKEDKDYIGAFRPAFSGSNNKSMGGTNGSYNCYLSTICAK